MENKNKKLEIFLLPGYFKIIGIAVVLLSVIVAIIIKLLHIEMDLSQKEFFRELFFNVIILGIFFFSMSRNKIEDERTLIIRLKAMGFTFSWVVLYVIMRPLVDLLFKYPPKNLTGQHVVLSMLFVYLITYYLQKRKS